jgi:uncharacterized protein YheU (UPF0270 family)
MLINYTHKMITVSKQTLINLIQSFIVQGADDQINFGHILSPEEYNESIEFQLKQIEIIIHDDLKQDCNCDMCNYYANSQNDYDLRVLQSENNEC